MLRNTAETYGSIAKWLHWIMALWFLVAVAIILYLTHDHTEGPVPHLNYHKVVGFTILVPLCFRLYWRLTNPEPELPAGLPRWQVRVSRLSHRLLYVLMFAMPISGYLGNGGGVDYGVFRIPAFRSTGLAAWLVEVTGTEWRQWDVFFDTFHYRIVGPYVFSTLVAVHVGAALFHHFVQKDEVLKRMWPGKDRQGSG